MPRWHRGEMPGRKETLICRAPPCVQSWWWWWWWRRADAARVHQLTVKAAGKLRLGEVAVTDLALLAPVQSQLRFGGLHLWRREHEGEWDQGGHVMFIGGRGWKKANSPEWPCASWAPPSWAPFADLPSASGATSLSGTRLSTGRRAGQTSSRAAVGRPAPTPGPEGCCWWDQRQRRRAPWSPGRSGAGRAAGSASGLRFGPVQPCSRRPLPPGGLAPPQRAPWAPRGACQLCRGERPSLRAAASTSRFLRWGQNTAVAQLQDLPGFLLSEIALIRLACLEQ